MARIGTGEQARGALSPDPDFWASESAQNVVLEQVAYVRFRRM